MIQSSVLTYLEYLVLRNYPPGADETAYGLWMRLLMVLTALSEIVALGLGIAGALQRRRKRLFAFLGVACSIFVLALINT